VVCARLAWHYCCFDTEDVVQNLVLTYEFVSRAVDPPTVSWKIRNVWLDLSMTEAIALHHDDLQIFSKLSVVDACKYCGFVA
jgi:hypothetical protein